MCPCVVKGWTRFLCDSDSLEFINSLGRMGRRKKEMAQMGRAIIKDFRGKRPARGGESFVSLYLLPFFCCWIVLLLFFTSLYQTYIYMYKVYRLTLIHSQGPVEQCVANTAKNRFVCFNSCNVPLELSLSVGTLQHPGFWHKRNRWGVGVGGVGGLHSGSAAHTRVGVGGGLHSGLAAHIGWKESSRTVRRVGVNSNVAKTSKSKSKNY